MHKILILLLALLSATSYAQSTDDIGKIIIGVDVPETSSQVTQELKDYIYNKVSHWVSQAGYSANGITPFYLCPDISIESEDVAEGVMKNVYVVTGTLNLKIIQSNDNVIFSSITLPIRDSSTSKIAAIKNGIGNLQYGKISPLLDAAKEKIIKYYETEKTVMFAQADLMVKQQNYDGAIAYLMSIPSCLTPIYLEALEKADSILDKKVEAYNDSLLSVAIAMMANHNASAALETLISYQKSNDHQNERYQSVLNRAEEMVTEAELEVIRNRRQLYLDEKEREYRRWKVEDQERTHRINMDKQYMTYKKDVLASNEKITSQRINAIKSIAADYYRSNQIRKKM